MVTACETCGLVLEIDLESGRKSVCPRCKAVIVSRGGGMFNSLMFAVASLLLVLPVSFFPFMNLYINDDKSSATLIQTAQVMFSDGFGLAGLVILFTALIFPVIYLILIIYTSFACLIRVKLPFVWVAVRLVSTIHHYQMTDVFIVGILISIIKLVDIADISFGSGFYCMIAMAFLLIISGSYYDKRLFWCRMAHEKR